VYFNPITSTSGVSIKLTASEPVDWTTVRVQGDVTSTNYTDFHPTLDGQATTTISWDGILSHPASVTQAPDGAYNINYNITDLAGNPTDNLSSSSLKSPQIIVDTVAPTITSFTSPVENKVYEGTGTTANILTFTPKDTGGTGSTPITCGYSLNGAATTTLLSSLCVNGTASSATIAGLQDGRNTIALQVTDAAGNVVYSPVVSFVYDNNNTLTVAPASSTPTPDFNTIQEAVSAATTGDTIAVSEGAYTGTVNLNKSLTLTGVSGADFTGQINIKSDSVTIDGMDITNPSAGYGIVDSGYGSLTIKNNNLHDIGTSSSITASAQAIYINGGSSTSMSGITISGNTITNVGSANIAGTHSSKGIYIGDSSGTNTISGVTIDGNTITNVTASPAAWTATPKGEGAYGVLVNHGSSAGGSTTGLKIKGNTISGLNGLWAHAIGLEGNTPNAQITGNIISGLTDNKSGTDSVGIVFQDNPNANTVIVSKNQFAVGIIGIGNDTTTATNIAVATGNWWGSAEGPITSSLSYKQNPHGAGASTYGFVTFTPWCTTADCASLDTSAPTADITNAPSNPTNVASPSFTVGSSASDVVYYKYQIDSGAWSTSTSTATTIALSSLANSSHTLNIVGRDQAGNWQATTSPTTYTWTVDTVAPVLTEVTPISNANKHADGFLCV